MRRVIASVIVALALAGCGTEGYSEDEAFEAQYRDLITKVRYCNYGAVSRAQYEGCVDHVSAREIERGSLSDSPTAAELYALGELNRCLADAGPACDDETRGETADIMQGD